MLIGELKENLSVDLLSSTCCLNLIDNILERILNVSALQTGGGEADCKLNSMIHNGAVSAVTLLVSFLTLPSNK